ncbi:MAG TPA: cytochrome c-type biogenesis protein CcmH [Bryobacteraceae bacterium]|jgi:cytochrome c-type biogenesis protein CcmH/NrfF|nr:cytochrome c-type biogenesis protein CcmH [Bryobacteraceae bacterium]
MRKLKTSLLLAAVAALALAQTASDLESGPVNRIAEKLSCPCGCKMNMACRMDPYPCPVCRKAKVEIFEAQTQGKSDQQIFDQFVAENGKDILAIGPGLLGVFGPYAALLMGLGVVILVVRRMMHRPPAAATGEVDPTVLDRYHDDIEKDLAKLE